MNQYYYNKQSKARWVIAGAPFRLLSRTNLSTCQEIGAIELFSMHKAKGYNSVETVKEISKKSNRMTI